jgi:hypothetical protein
MRLRKAGKASGEWVVIGRSGAAALLSVVLAGCGGTEIKGIVRDEESGQPLPGAIVRIGDETTRTGAGGFYELDVDVEDHEPAQVMVGAAGYEPNSMIVTFDEDQDTVYSDIDLKKEFSRREFDREQLDLQRRQLEQDRRDFEREKRELDKQRKQQDVTRPTQQELEQNVQEAEQAVEDAAEQLDEVEKDVQQSDDTWTPVEPVDQPEGE